MNLNQIERALNKYASKDQDQLFMEYVQRRLDKTLLMYLDDIDKLQKQVYVGMTSKEFLRRMDNE